MHRQVDDSLRLACGMLLDQNQQPKSDLLTFASHFGDKRQRAEAQSIVDASKNRWNAAAESLLQLLSRGELTEVGLRVLLRALVATADLQRTGSLISGLLKQPHLSIKILVDLVEAALTIQRLDLYQSARELILGGGGLQDRNTIKQALGWAIRTKNRNDFYQLFKLLSDDERQTREYRLKQFEIEAEAGSSHEAERILRGLLEENPQDYVVNSFLIRLLLDLNRHKESLSLLEQYPFEVIKNDPFMLESYFGVLTRMEKYARVLKESESLINASDLTVRYLALRVSAESLYKLGHLEASLQKRGPMEELESKLGLDSSLFWATVASHADENELADGLFSRMTSEGNTDASYEYSLHLLKRGRFREAWPLYEHRFSILKSLKKYASYDNLLDLEMPRLDALDLIRIFPEQGLGDQLLFLRYVPYLKALGVKVVLYSEERLRRVLELCPALDSAEKFNIGESESANPAKSESTLTISTGSIPLLLERMSISLGLPPPLTIDGHRLDGWPISGDMTSCEDRPPNGRLRVGLAWRGASNMNAALKSVQFERIVPVISALPDCDFANCNYLHDTITEIRDGGLLDRFVAPEPPPETQLLDVIRLLQSCDVIVSTSQTYVHLAAMLTKPVLLLLPNPSAELWYWRSIDTIEASPEPELGKVVALRFNQTSEEFPAKKIENWIKKPAH